MALTLDSTRITSTSTELRTGFGTGTTTQGFSLASGNISFPISYSGDLNPGASGAITCFRDGLTQFYIRNRPVDVPNSGATQMTIVPFSPSFNPVSGESRAGMTLQPRDITSGPYFEMVHGSESGFTIGTNRIGTESVPTFPIVFQINFVEMMRLRRDNFETGVMCLGRSTPLVDATLTVQSTGAGNPAMRLVKPGVPSSTYTNLWVLGFAGSGPGDPGVGMGAFVINNNSVALSQTSDHRVKADVQPLTQALDRIQGLRPIEFNWRQSPTATPEHGFLAHEYQAVLPDAVTGVQDQVDPEGNPVYQSLAMQHTIPWLTRAVQELYEATDRLRDRLATNGA